MEDFQALLFKHCFAQNVFALFCDSVARATEEYFFFFFIIRYPTNVENDAKRAQCSELSLTVK